MSASPHKSGASTANARASASGTSPETTKKAAEKALPARYIAARDAPSRIALFGLGIIFLLSLLAFLFPELVLVILVGGGILLVGGLYYLSENSIRSVVMDASELLFGVYGIIDEKKAYDLLYNYVIYNEAPIVLLQRGQIDVRSFDSPLLKLGFRGPGFVGVDLWTAILVQTPRGLKIESAGQYFLNKGEMVRGYVDLSLQHKTLVLENVHTKDNIPLKINATFYYRIIQDLSRLRRQLKNAPREDAVKLAVLTTTDWKGQSEATAAVKIRDAIAQSNFDDIHKSYPRLLESEGDSNKQDSISIEPSLPRIELQNTLSKMVNHAVRSWGVEVVAVTLDEISIPEEVRKTLKDSWAAAWKHKVEYEAANNDVRIEKKKAEGRRDAAEIDRTSEMIRAIGKAESSNVIARAESEQKRVVSDAESEAERLRSNAQTESKIEFLRRMDQVLSQSGLPKDSATIKEYLSFFRLMFPEKQNDSRRSKGERDEKRDLDESDQKGQDNI